nr:MAG TPA: hypothetical protein [Caudoviricetes sp.]
MCLINIPIKLLVKCLRVKRVNSFSKSLSGK